MNAPENSKSISYLKNHAVHISEELKRNGGPLFITKNGQASMVLEGVKQHREKVELIALLKVIALGEKDRLAGKGFSIMESRAVLASAMKRR